MYINIKYSVWTFAWLLLHRPALKLSKGSETFNLLTWTIRQPNRSVCYHSNSFFILHPQKLIRWHLKTIALLAFKSNNCKNGYLHIAPNSLHNFSSHMKKRINLLWMWIYYRSLWQTNCLLLTLVAPNKTNWQNQLNYDEVDY